ncbi:MAG: DNA polymerase/3'-5' exonuclease PolX [Bryobacteraceae bacterium]|nr:DNA polymerase/3'-5' exonuclease PolX [Bryobacteraceae bacterium]
MENAGVARLLTETADLMEIAGEDPFRIRSYRNAATAVEGSPERVLDLLNSPDKKVTDIPGIGKGMAAIFAEIAERGSFERRDQMLEKYPPTALELLKIQGLGPKSIALIIEHFRVTTIDDLEKLCLDQKLRTLPRMGAKLEEKVLKSIAQYRRSAGRFLLSFADTTAAAIGADLAGVSGVTRVTPAGSLRRGRETAGDLDLLVTGPNAVAALEVFVRHSRVSEVLARGENKASALVGVEGLQVDVRTLPEANYGAALQYFTGSKEHNVVLRTRAVRMGFSLNEYGLSRASDGSFVATKTEEEIYAALGLDWIPPELRENRGEIEAAEAHSLPKLIEREDIRGDLHMHTTETDGRASLEEMAEHARALSHEYIAITDHSKALAMANGLDEKRAIAFARRVRDDQASYALRVFSGIECDILRDGKMDLDDEALAALDMVIASVHSYMNLSPEEMTDRYLAAIDNKYVRAIGHPTGRVLLHRDGFPFDFDRVVDAAVKRGVWLELNASPERLDLSDTMLRAAKARGAKFVISTDAHHPRHLANIRYGVLTARRAWLDKSDVVNTLPADEFTALLRK